MERLDSKETVLKIKKILEEKRGKDVVIYDVGKMTSFTRYIILATFKSDVQIKTVLKEMNQQIKRPDHIEGKPESGWVLLDFDVMVVNLFLEEERDFYGLERLWGEAEKVE